MQCFAVWRGVVWQVPLRGMNLVSDEQRNSIDQPPAGEVSVPPASEEAASVPANDAAASSESAPPPEDETVVPAEESPVDEAASAESGSVKDEAGDVEPMETVADESFAIDDEPEVELAADDTTTGMIEETPEDDDSEQQRDWYILKVQSNREDSIRDGLMRRVKIAGLERYFGDAIVPIEMVTEFKGGKKRVVKRKLYPGYIVVNMVINDETWFLVRETPGIGDFTGSAGKPSPMLPQEVARIVQKAEEKDDDAPKLKIAFSVGDRVKINEGTFENFDGEVDSIDEANGRVTVMINIFGRSTPVELEYWQIEAV